MNTKPSGLTSLADLPSLTLNERRSVLEEEFSEQLSSLVLDQPHPKEESNMKALDLLEGDCLDQAVCVLEKALRVKNVDEDDQV